MNVDRRGGVLRRWVVGMALLCASCVEATEFTPLPPSVPQLRLPRNDVYEGSVITGSLRPTFVWEPSTFTTGGPLRYELQYSADRELADAITIETTEPTFRPSDALPVSTVPPVGRRYYWRVRACIPAICSGYSPTWWVNLGRSNKDFNGDGYADVAVGATLGLSNGRVFIYLGGPGPMFDTTIDAIIANPGTSLNFGRSLGGGGDFNGDGFADFLVGSEGDAYLYFGSPSPTFNQDGHLTFRGLAADDYAASVAFAGDLNADGNSDIAIGIPRSFSGGSQGGVVQVYFSGSSGRPSGLLTTNTLNLRLGTYLSGGDLNGDGYSDLVATAGGFSDQFQNTPCIARIYFGGSRDSFDETHDWTIEEDTAIECSFRAAVAGDLNHDGFVDVFSARNGNGLTVDIYAGSKTIASTPSKTEPIPNSSSFSSHLNPVGDINGDGFHDFAITGEYGGVTYMGHATNDDERIATFSARKQWNTYFSPAGDLNGDGYDDVVLGGSQCLILFGAPGGTLDITPEGILSVSDPSSIGFGRAVL